MARQLGQILVDMGFIDDGQLEMLVEEHAQQPSVQIGKVAEDMGLVIDTQLVQALAEQFNLQIIDLGEISIAEEILDEISETMAQMYRTVPVQLTGNLLTVAVSHPENITVADELRTFLGRDIQLVVCTELEIDNMLEEFYDSKRETIERIVANLEQDNELKQQIEALSTGPIDLTGAEALADSVPVRKLLNMVLLLAIKDHASDVHFEPFEDEFRIRIKADGVLYEMVPPPRRFRKVIESPMGSC
jgi:type IV pilus assembly protein PilB